jgi:hypothetical protein
VQRKKDVIKKTALQPRHQLCPGEEMALETAYDEVMTLLMMRPGKGLLF